MKVARTLSTTVYLALSSRSPYCRAENREGMRLWMKVTSTVTVSRGSEGEPLIQAGLDKSLPKRPDLWARVGKREPAGEKTCGIGDKWVYVGLEDLSPPSAKSMPRPFPPWSHCLWRLRAWRFRASKVYIRWTLGHTFLVRWDLFHLVILLSFAILSISASQK